MRRPKTWKESLGLLGLALLAGAALILLTLLPAFAQEAKKAEPGKPWTGKLADGREITKADLDKILEAHSIWLKRNYDELKERGPFFLSPEELSKTNTIWNISKDKKGQRADLKNAKLGRVELRKAILALADLTNAELSGAEIWEANLSGAILLEANLSGADLRWANLRVAGLNDSNLSWAWLGGADLSWAKIWGANLSGARLNGANLSGASFEPKPGTVSDVGLLLNIQGLSSLRYDESPHGLFELRETFKKAGMRNEERELTFALNHNRRERLLERGGFMNRIESLFHLICFEWTCGYGLYPGRPLKIMGLGLLFFTVPYLMALGARKPETGLWVILLPDRVLDKNIKDKPVKLTFENPFLPPAEGRGIRFRRSLPRFLRVLWVGLHFSLLSAFSLGWRELNVGNWITRIQKREYNLRATGWVRSVAGVQSLLSIYLLALWVLSYFGRPFD